jgi:peptide/nickel transport system permease protein
VSTSVVLQARRHARRLALAPTLVVSVAVLAAICVAALAGEALAPHDPSAQDLDRALLPPGDGHLLGTDDVGRDVFSRLLAGARSAIVGPLAVALGAMAIGNAAGLIAGYHGGWFDAAITRWIDFTLSLPALLVAVVLIGVLGGGYTLAVGLLIVLFAPNDARVVRGATLEQRAKPYVEAARTLGVPSARIVAWHIWPNVSAVAVATACLNFAFALVALSGLAFLGIGAAAGSADWGRMLADNRALIFDAPLASLAPGALIVATAVAFNVLGDWLYERLSGQAAPR